MNKIHFGQVQLNDVTSIVEARNKIRMLALDLGYSEIGATKLATAVSELIRGLRKGENGANMQIDFEEREKRFGLCITFYGQMSDADTKCARAFFDAVETSQSEGGMLQICAFKYFPAHFVPTSEFISSEREKIVRLSRAELASELKRKNDELLSLFDDLKNEKAKMEIMLEDIKSVDKIKSDLVSTVSHELRTPLTSVKGYIDIILDGDTGSINDMQRDFLETVKKNTDRLVILINDFLDIQKMESKNLTMNISHVSLSSIVEDAAKAVELTIREKGLEFQKSIEPDIFAWVDGDRISQILWNLLSNSTKYSESGYIHLVLTSIGDNALISVKDTGIGMSAEEQKKLFSKFFRADSKVVKDAGGTGLGLAIVKELVIAHNGKIDVQSELGKGTTFTIILPMGHQKYKWNPEITHRKIYN